jgi:hypothetical protein
MPGVFVYIASIRSIRVPGIGVQVASHLEAFYKGNINLLSIIVGPVILPHDSFVRDLRESIGYIDGNFHRSGTRIPVSCWRLLVVVKVLVNTFFIMGGPKDAKLYLQLRTHHDKFVTEKWFGLIHEFESNKPESFNGLLTKFLPQEETLLLDDLQPWTNILILAITIDSVGYKKNLPIPLHSSRSTLLGRYYATPAETRSSTTHTCIAEEDDEVQNEKKRGQKQKVSGRKEKIDKISSKRPVVQDMHGIGK